MSLIVFIGALAETALAQGSKWQPVVEEDGIAISKRRNPKTGLTGFRGLTTIGQSLYQLMAVLHDVKRHTEWMHKCTEARIVKRLKATRFVVYNRIDAPWPFSDRDVVALVNAELADQGRRFVARFDATRDYKVADRSGVVRMHRMSGTFVLTWGRPERTRVVYEVEADPGGWIPRWAANLANKEIPLETLRSLRRQARRTRGWYQREIDRWRLLSSTQEGPGRSAPQ